MAATVGVINGTDLLVYVDDTAISYSTSCSLSITGAGPIDVSNKDSGYWNTKLKGRGVEWTMSCSGMLGFDGAGTSIREIFLVLGDNTTVNLKFATATAGDLIFHGSAQCTGLTMDGPDNEGATFSCDFAGLGRLLAVTT